MGHETLPQIKVFAKSSNEVRLDCVDWAVEISRAFVPDLVVFLAKSGFIFGKVLSDVFGCPLVDIRVSRVGNSGKDAIAKAIPWIPWPVLSRVLKSKHMYAFNDNNNEREVEVSERFQAINYSEIKRILVVDDSVDTGWSALAALNVVKDVAPECEIKIASYCTIDARQLKVKVDFSRYHNTIIVTSTSRYSAEYQSFLKEFEEWKHGARDASQQCSIELKDKKYDKKDRRIEMPIVPITNLLTNSAMKHIEAGPGQVVIEGDRLIQLQKIMVSMLKDIMVVGEEEGIEVLLAYGSCLGAIRHEGFIPWDDDLDVIIPRASYNRFIQAFENRYEDEYWVHTPEKTINYGRGIARIRKKGTVMSGPGDYATDEDGVYVDIFVLENAPRNKAVRQIHCILSLGFGFALSCRRFAFREKRYKELIIEDENLKKAIALKTGIGKALSFASLEWWTRAWNDCNKLCRDNESPFVVIPTGPRHYSGELFSRTDILPGKPALFDGLRVKVPYDSDKFLTNEYGDYMALPPEDDREAHIVYELDLGDFGIDKS